MGLYDHPGSQDSFSFANFDSANAPSGNTSNGKTSSLASSSLGSMSDTASAKSHSTSQSSPKKPGLTFELTKPQRPSLPSSSTSSRKARPKYERRRASSFDLYGEDDELQRAEPSINFCEICCKHCYIH